jgi:hypothetical protein
MAPLLARIIGLPHRRESCWDRVVRITSETVTDGIREQRFTIGDIPGVLWTPAGAAAVLGLIGSDWLTEIAARITIPVEFVLQWDDEGSRGTPS